MVAADWGMSPSGASVASAAPWPQAGFGPASFAGALQRTDEQIALGEERVQNGPDQWLRQESLGRALIARSRYSGSFDELARASTVLDRAMTLAPKGSGPLLSAAVMAMMTHRLSQVETALETIDRWAVPPDQADLAEISGLRGDLAFYRGDSATASSHYSVSRNLGGGSGAYYRLAQLEKTSGQFDRALVLLRSAARDPAMTTPFALASTAAQLGGVELARGNYAEAWEWFETADRTFSGYWLFEAHLAQAMAIDGDIPGGIADMRRIAEQSGSAEVMDALAMLLRSNGEAAESRRWAARAGEIWQRRLSQLPEAAYGHAIEHELVFGTPDKAVALGRLNLAARPYGESRILLASALLAKGMTSEALAQLALAQQSGWNSAPLHALRAQAHELAGDLAEAEQARAAAQALNPRIFDAETALVWFSHG